MDRANTASPLQGPAFVQTNCNKAEGCFLSPGKGELHSWPEEKKKNPRRCGHPRLQALSLAPQLQLDMEHRASPPGAAVQLMRAVERDISSSVLPGGCKDQRTCWRSSGKVWCRTRSPEFQASFHHCLFLLVAHT